MKTRTLFLALIVAFLGIWYFASKSTNKIKHSNRPNDPWVFRSVLDKQPRMITFALNDHLWVSYSTDSCSLYKAWGGSTDFSGAVYNMRHGPHPMSIGASWFENKYPKPWSVTFGGKTEQPRTDYKGHRYTANGRAEISVPDGEFAAVHRVYDATGRFDETAPVSLAQVHAASQEQGIDRAATRRIPVTGGAVTVAGSGLGPGATVQTLGEVIRHHTASSN